VGDAALREVVGADLGRAVARAHLRLARGGLLGLGLGEAGVEQLGAQQVHGLGAVLVLAALVLAGHHDAARKVRDAHGRIGLVDVLAARAAGAVGVDLEVLVADRDVVHFVGDGHDDDGGGGGVHPALGLGVGHALHAVHAALVLEHAVHAVALDFGHDFLVAAHGALAGAHHREPPAARAGVVLVHAVEASGEQAGLVAARAGAALEHGGALVGRVLGHEQEAQGLLLGGQFGLDAGQLLAGHGLQLGVGTVERGLAPVLEVVQPLEIM